MVLQCKSEVPALVEREVEASLSLEAQGQSTIDVPFDDHDGMDLEPRFQLRLELDDEGRFAHLVVEEGQDGVVDAKGVFQALNAKGVVHGLNTTEIEALCERLMRGNAELGDRLCAAEWTPPQEPEGPTYSLILPDLDDAEQPAEDDESGRVDFKEIKTDFHKKCSS